MQKRVRHGGQTAYVNNVSVSLQLTSQSFFTSAQSTYKRRIKQWTKGQLNRRSVTCCVEQPQWRHGPMDADFVKDSKLFDLESALDAAVLREDFTSAAQIREELLRLQSGAYVEVLTANMKFYNAFQSGSLVDMAACWMQDARATCKHPLGPLVVGYLDILNSFGQLFSLGIPQISPVNVRIAMRGTVALATCEEQPLETHQFDEDKKAQIKEWNPNFDDTPAQVVMLATNIFEKKNGQWYLVHHVSSPKFPSI